MKKYGLIGTKLNYSYSKLIHERLGNLMNIEVVYDLIETDELSKINFKEYSGLNITTPFKKEILNYTSSCDNSVDIVKCCNTLDEKQKGYNTDVLGFEYLLASISIDISLIKRIVIMGSGATSQMIQNVFGSDVECVVLSQKNDSYSNTKKIYGDLLFNTTPLGMGDLVDKIAIDENLIANFKAVIDLNYNPIINKLLYTASKHKIVNANGLDMLIFQAIKAFEIWHDVIVDNEFIKIIKKEILNLTTKGTAIIGMPLSGKSHYFANSIKESSQYFDLDDYIENKIDMKIFDYINLNGENKFRDLETECLKEIINNGIKYIACGGGIIERWENRYILKEYQIINISKP
ncbi:MAG: shikimate kinase, partial [Mycoplasmatales bacterium]